MTCPHCGAGDLDAGATGLDMCWRCGGLSRGGRPLARQHPFQTFSIPKLADISCVEPEQAMVAGALVDGRPSLIISFVIGGKALPPFVLSGDHATNFAQLVDDAMRSAQATGN